MRWIAGLVAGMLVVQGAAARAQGELPQHTPFLDASDVFANLPGHQTVFEGQLSPNLVMSQNLSDRLGELDPRFGGSVWGHAHAFSFDPMVRLRMLQQFSEPVRTPSYMPKLTFQEFFYRARGTSSPSVDLIAAQFTIGHHSNGQDGCTFLDQQVQGDACLPQRLDRDAATAPVNTRDGSFSTNYMTVGARFRRTLLDANNTARLDWTLGADLEVNPTRFFGDGGLAAELSYLYGPTRFSVIAGAAKRAGRVCSRLEVLGTAKYIPGAPSIVPKIATTIRGACVFSESGGWGVVLGYFRGQDYYNLNFLQDISTFRIGLTYEQDGFLRFKH
jgi:hypothetical protein